MTCSESIPTCSDGNAAFGGARSPAMTRWQDIKALKRQDWSVLTVCWVAFPFAALLIRARGIQALRRLSRPPAGTPRADPRRVAALVDACARRSPIAVSCLTRSAVLAWLLRRRGIAARLRVGVRILDGRMEAHAWLEHEGVPLNDTVQAVKHFQTFEEDLLARTVAPR